MKQGQDTQSVFGVIVRNLLIAKRITTRNGNPDWVGFVNTVQGVSYETLRKAVTGERAPSPGLMEDVARALDEEPGIFAEYRLWRYRRLFDPAVVGLDQALLHLENARAA